MGSNPTHSFRERWQSLVDRVRFEIGSPFSTGPWVQIPLAPFYLNIPLAYMVSREAVKTASAYLKWEVFMGIHIPDG